MSVMHSLEGEDIMSHTFPYATARGSGLHLPPGFGI
jgi:hypothetical protein